MALKISWMISYRKCCFGVITINRCCSVVLSMSWNVKLMLCRVAHGHYLLTLRRMPCMSKWHWSASTIDRPRRNEISPIMRGAAVVTAAASEKHVCGITRTTFTATNAVTWLLFYLLLSVLRRLLFLSSCRCLDMCFLRRRCHG